MTVNYDCLSQKSDFTKLKNFKRIDGIELNLKLMQDFLKQIPEDLWDPVTHQLCFTHTNLEYKEKPNLIYEGCGSLTYQWSFQPYDQERKLKKRETKLYESDFTEFHPEFVSSPIHDVFLQLRQRFKVGRFRLMKLSPKKCMSWHTDESVRIHFAINTEGSCRMVIDDEAAHIPADGAAYICNTRKPHTALNGSHRCQRVHLVVSLDMDEDNDFFPIEQATLTSF